MTTTREDLTPWLGDTAADLTTEQLDRLCAEADRIDARYPDPDEADERNAALSAAVQYLLGDADASTAGAELAAARAAAERAMVAAQQIAVMTVADGGSEAETARRIGVTRMTVRQALGKR